MLKIYSLMGIYCKHVKGMYHGTMFLYATIFFTFNTTVAIIQINIIRKSKLDFYIAWIMQKEVLNVEHLHLSFVNFFNADFTSGRTSLKSSLFSCRSRRRFGGHDAPAISFCASSRSMTVGRVLSSV